MFSLVRCIMVLVPDSVFGFIVSLAGFYGMLFGFAGFLIRCVIVCVGPSRSSNVVLTRLVELVTMIFI